MVMNGQYGATQATAKSSILSNNHLNETEEQQNFQDQTRDIFLKKDLNCKDGVYEDEQIVWRTDIETALNRTHVDYPLLKTNGSSPSNYRSLNHDQQLAIAEEDTKSASGIDLNKRRRHGAIFRVRTEIFGGENFFSLDEYDGAIIDIQESFAPRPFFLTFLARLLLLASTVSFAVWDARKTLRTMSILRYLGHLTNITMILTILYMLTILSYTFLRVCLKRNPSLGQCGPGIFICICWFLYVTSMISEFVVAFGFWTFEYDPAKGIQFDDLFKHFLIGFLILFDGNVVGRIPLKMKQFLFPFSYLLLYVLYSVVSQTLDIKSGVIYPNFDWKRDASAAANETLVLVFVSALIFILCWLISLWSICCKFHGGRRHIHLVKSDTID